MLKYIQPQPYKEQPRSIARKVRAVNVSARGVRGRFAPRFFGRNAARFRHVLSGYTILYIKARLRRSILLWKLTIIRTFAPLKYVQFVYENLKLNFS